MFRKVLLLVVTAVLLLLVASPALAADCPCTVDTLAVTTGTVPLGDSGGNEIGEAQTFIAPGNGQVSAFQIKFGANVGSPTGDITWSIAGDYLGQPGVEVIGGTVTPVASSIVNVTVNAGVNLNSGANYWITFRAPSQPNDNRYQLVNATTSTYANGIRWTSTNSAAWVQQSATDLHLIMTLGAVSSTSTPTSTVTPSNTSTPTATFTPTLTPTPEYFVIATLPTQAMNYPVVIYPRTDHGQIGLTVVILCVFGLLFVWFLKWLRRRSIIDVPGSGDAQ